MTPDWASWSGGWLQDVIFLSFSSAWEPEHPRVIRSENQKYCTNPLNSQCIYYLVFTLCFKFLTGFCQFFSFLHLKWFHSFKRGMDGSGSRIRSSLPPGLRQGAWELRSSASSVARWSPHRFMQCALFYLLLSFSLPTFSIISFAPLNFDILLLKFPWRQVLFWT